jgi:hypothetical protein
MNAPPLLTTDKLVPRSRMCSGLPLRPLYAFMLWCLGTGKTVFLPLIISTQFSFNLIQLNGEAYGLNLDLGRGTNTHIWQGLRGFSSVGLPSSRLDIISKWSSTDSLPNLSNSPHVFTHSFPDAK